MISCPDNPEFVRCDDKVKKPLYSIKITRILSPHPNATKWTSILEGDFISMTALAFATKTSSRNDPDTRSAGLSIMIALGFVPQMIERCT